MRHDLRPMGDRHVITLTAAAIEKIKAMAATAARAPNIRIRVLVMRGVHPGFSYDISFDGPDVRKGDLVSDVAGVRVAVDPTSVPYIRGTTIDYTESLKYSGLQFRNPNARRTCGCGSSFGI